MELTLTSILLGVLTLLVAIVGFLLRHSFDNIINKLESLVKAVNDLKLVMTSHEKDIEHIKERLQSHSERLHDLEKRNTE